MNIKIKIMNIWTREHEHTLQSSKTPLISVFGSTKLQVSDKISFQFEFVLNSQKNILFFQIYNFSPMSNVLVSNVGTTTKLSAAWLESLVETHLSQSICSLARNFSLGSQSIAAPACSARDHSFPLRSTSEAWTSVRYCTDHLCSAISCGPLSTW